MLGYPIPYCCFGCEISIKRARTRAAADIVGRAFLFRYLLYQSYLCSVPISAKIMKLQQAQDLSSDAFFPTCEQVLFSVSVHLRRQTDILAQQVALSFTLQRPTHMCASSLSLSLSRSVDFVGHWDVGREEVRKEESAVSGGRRGQAWKRQIMQRKALFAGAVA